MGKYNTKNIMEKIESNGIYLENAIHICILNELAEANRLKRIEIRLNNPQMGADFEKDFGKITKHDFEDQA